LLRGHHPSSARSYILHMHQLSEHSQIAIESFVAPKPLGCGKHQRNRITLSRARNTALAQVSFASRTDAEISGLRLRRGDRPD
jgi:hypothetical protein